MDNRLEEVFKEEYYGCGGWKGKTEVGRLSGKPCVGGDESLVRDEVESQK